MPKFFVKDNQIKNNEIDILGQDVKHIINVLRMQKGDVLQICNQDTSQNYLAIINKYSSDIIECKIKEKLNISNESNVEITVFQGLPKFDKMELIIQKNIEIGVKSIVPIKMERTIVKLNEKDSIKKVERWKKIAEIAAKQSMRDFIPNIENIKNFKQFLEELKNYDNIIIAYEKESDTTLKYILKNKIQKKLKYKIGILIGPEGGISDKEIILLKKMENTEIVTLGKRILRTETAALVMASNILYELEM